MNRCAMTLLVALSAWALLPAAQAQVTRSFPQNALRGEIVVVQPPEVLLNGQAARLAPGARLRDMNNMIQVSGALVGAKLVVNYTVDTSGLVKDVWVLQPGEIARRPWPRTPLEAQAWLFDPAAQTWTKP